jgi:hypothetical protein
MRRGLGVFLLIVCCFVVFVAGQGTATLMLQFRDMDPHVGQAFSVRVVDEASGAEVDRLSVSGVPSASFDLEFVVPTGSVYRLDFYADMNANGRYDPPPVDHAWRIQLADVQENRTVLFSHDLAFTDIDWPPLVDGRVEAGDYRHSLNDSRTGMTVYWQNDDLTLRLGLTSPGTGWLAIGFRPERRMLGADTLITAVTGDGVIVEDDTGTGQTSHRVDATSRVLDAAGLELDGRTTVELVLPLAGGESGTTLTPGETLSVILAYHASSDRLTTRHSKRTTTQITLDGQGSE